MNDTKIVNAHSNILFILFVTFAMFKADCVNGASVNRILCIISLSVSLVIVPKYSRHMGLWSS